MGTNYYARIIPSKKRKDYLKKLINEDKFIEINNELESMYGRYSDDKTSEVSEIHLGKRSAGWKFLFNPNYEKYYPLTREGLMNFLKREDVVIYSEYFNGDDHVYGYTNDPDEPYNKNEYLNFGAEDYKKIDKNLKTEIDIINTKPDDLEEGQTENDSQKNNHIEENIIGDYQNYIVDRENAESIEAGERRIRIH